MKFIALFFIIFTFTVQASYCDLSEGLTKKQIKLLKRAEIEKSGS